MAQVRGQGDAADVRFVGFRSSPVLRPGEKPQLLHRRGGITERSAPPGLPRRETQRSRSRRGAGDGNRTHVTSLEGWSSAIELHPRGAAWHRPGQALPIIASGMTFVQHPAPRTPVFLRRSSSPRPPGEKPVFRRKGGITERSAPPGLPRRETQRSQSRLGAVDETRTRDLNLGKVALYQLSYYRRNGALGRN